jgi:pimeloyl-ACP methyl ester carboxylesterase
VSVLGSAPALEAALAWYRAAGALANMEIAPVTVPTLYVWGEQDSSVGRSAAEWTAEHVHGRYRFAPLAGCGHFLTDQAPDVISALLLEHVTAP